MNNIKKTFDNEFIKKTVYLESVDSTNTYAKKHSFNENTLIISEMQTNGRGRTGKTWVSKPGCGIYMSIVLFPSVKVTEIMKLTIVCGTAVCEALNEVCNIGAKIKWPNDIVADGKKICGILTECICSGECVEKAICGIGINVNTKEFPEEIQNVASSLYRLTGNEFDRSIIIGEIIETFARHYTDLISGDKSGKIIRDYKNLCVNIGRKVITTGNPQISGTAVDIAPDGELIIKTADGKEVAVNSGEVSVRGEGYI